MNNDATKLHQKSDEQTHVSLQIPQLHQQSIGVVIGKCYPAPIVDHATQRSLALDLYKLVALVRHKSHGHNNCSTLYEGAFCCY